MGVFGCTRLTNISIPDSVTSIGETAFANCTSLTSVRIPNSIASIGGGAFRWCTNLTNITIPNSVITIAVVAFNGCDNLTSVTIPESVITIGDWAFSGCSSLTSVTIPKSVTSIGRGAFELSANLTTMSFEGNAPNLCDGIFVGSPQVSVYYLPGTTGWIATYSGRPTALWMLPNPVILTTPPAFGIQANQFGFIISWAKNASVVVEASTNLTNPTWSPVSTNTLVGGSSYFSDPGWTNFPSRFYRIRPM
jgi:hypothetical protein